MEAVLKTVVVKATVGSNPTSSATKKQSRVKEFTGRESNQRPAVFLTRDSGLGTGNSGLPTVFRGEVPKPVEGDGLLNR